MKLILKTAMAVALAATLAACEKPVEETREVRPGCEKMPSGLGPKAGEIVAPEIWQQVANTGSAWAVIVLADESAQDKTAKPDLEAIKAVQQRLLHDMDIRDDEKVFGAENMAVISMQLDPGRAKQLENLPYVCYVGSDRKLWPME